MSHKNHTLQQEKMRLIADVTADILKSKNLSVGNFVKYMYMSVWISESLSPR